MKRTEIKSKLSIPLYSKIVSILSAFEKHLDLEQRISRAIRQGYLHRNPMKKEEVMRVHESYKAIKEGKFIKNYQTEAKRTAAGFTIIGLSGIGKTTAIERVLSFYPQIIRHQEYQRRPFQFTQICWMKLDCPFDGSLKGLCILFRMDRLLGSNYLNKFGSQKYHRFNDAANGSPCKPTWYRAYHR